MNTNLAKNAANKASRTKWKRARCRRPLQHADEAQGGDSDCLFGVGSLLSHYCPTPPAISQEKMPTGLGSEYCEDRGERGEAERAGKAKGKRFDIFDWKAVGKLVEGEHGQEKKRKGVREKE